MRGGFAGTFGIVALVACAASARAAEPTVVKIEAVGTSFRATLSDGTIRLGTQLAGAVLVFRVGNELLRIRIASVIPDPSDKEMSGRVLLHDFRHADTDVPLCGPAPDGTRLGFPLAGRTTADGRFVEGDPGDFELICTSGAQGKCVRFGYRPWEKAPDGQSMRDYYNACVRMVRGDYCGDGKGWTRNGMLIDLWDRLGIQTPGTTDDPTFSFEAGWTTEGAVCVAHTRVPENITLDKLITYCPRLAPMKSCDESAARSAGALLFNRSR